MNTPQPRLTNSCRVLTNHLLLELVDQGLILNARFVEVDAVHINLDPTHRFHRISELDKLYSPQPGDGYVDIFFEDAGEWLILNHAISPFHIPHST